MIVLHPRTRPVVVPPGLLSRLFRIFLEPSEHIVLRGILAAFLGISTLLIRLYLLLEREWDGLFRLSTQRFRRKCNGQNCWV